jgi:TPR repeat protein
MKVMLFALFVGLLMVGCGNEETLFERSKRLAESGHAPAQFNLGLMYALGEGGLAEDKTEAVRWFRKAADQGEVKAQFNLALMYAFGEGGACGGQDRSRQVVQEGRGSG